MKYFFLLLLTLFLCLDLSAQALDALPTIDQPQEFDKIHTYTRGFSAAFRLDTLRKYFSADIVEGLAVNPNVSIPDSLRGRYFISTLDSLYYVDYFGAFVNLTPGTGGGGGISDAAARVIVSDTAATIRAYADTNRQVLPSGGAYASNQIVNNAGVLYQNISGDSLTYSAPGVGWVEYTKSENYNATGSKRLKQKIEANQKISVAVLGDSKTQSGGRGPSKLRETMQTEIGIAGFGYVVLDGGAAPGMNIVNVGATVHDTDVDYGVLSLSGYAIELNNGNSYGYSIPTSPTVFTHNDRVTVFYLSRSGNGTAAVRFGSDSTVINADNPTLAKQSVTLSSTYGPNSFLIDSIVGEVTITDVIFHSDTKTAGAWFHVIGNGGYTTTNLKDRFVEPLNQPVIDSINLDHAVIRTGTNDWSAGVVPSVLGASLDSIISEIKANNQEAEFTITGLEDATLGGSQDYDRNEYEAVQAGKAAEYGANYAPLSMLIPTWPQWDSLGYAEDNIHSNSAGGNLIGDFIYKIIKGDIAYKATNITSVRLGGLDPYAVVFTDENGNSTADSSKVYFNRTTNNLGLFNSNPSYTFDFPISPTNSWRLPGFTMTPTDGLLWDNTTSTGLEGDVIWNINPNNKFEVNMTGGGAEFSVTGLVPINLGESFKLLSSGGLLFDNTLYEGDVDFKIDSNNDFNVRLGSGGSGNFRVTWNDQALELMEAHFNKVEFGVPLILANVGGGANTTTGMLYRETTTNQLREMTWANLVTRLSSEGIATDAEVAAGGDNLGNHTLTQNIVTGSNWISGDGGNEGIKIDASGKVGIGATSPAANLDILSTAVAGREAIISAKVSDSGNAQFGIGNATSSAGQFIPTFFAYNNTSRFPFFFRSLTNAANVGASEASFHFQAGVTSSDTDPNNGSFTPVTRDLLTVENAGTTRLKLTSTGYLTGGHTYDIAQTLGAGQDGYVATYDHTLGRVRLEAAAAGADNLGNHTATTDLLMGGNDITFTSDFTNINGASGVARFGALGAATTVYPTHVDFTTQAGVPISGSNILFAREVLSDGIYTDDLYQNRLWLRTDKDSTVQTTIDRTVQLLTNEDVPLTFIKTKATEQVKTSGSTTDFAASLPQGRYEVTYHFRYKTNTAGGGILWFVNTNADIDASEGGFTRTDQFATETAWTTGADAATPSTVTNTYVGITYTGVMEIDAATTVTVSTGPNGTGNLTLGANSYVKYVRIKKP